MKKLIAAFLLFTVELLPCAAWGAPESPGAKLFKEKGCIGCHSIGGRGGHVGPELDTVGDRYTSEWIYVWLRNPAAVKPGTLMPNLHLTDEERALLVFFLSRKRASQRPAEVTTSSTGVVRTNPPDLNAASPENAYLSLGTKRSYIREERFTLQDQIQTFIPPIYEPAFTQSAFVLPPGAFRSTVSYRDVGTIHEGDVSDQRRIGARFVDFDLERTFLDFDAFLGLDHNFTLRLNVPFATSQVGAQLNPEFLNSVTVFPNGSSQQLGDIGLFIKKKFFDQGNFPISFAGVAGIRFPTGRNDEQFDKRTTVTTRAGNGLLPLPAVSDAGAILPGTADGTFRRFSNDGRLPAPLQPGLGTFSYALGAFASRVFEGNTLLGRGALHAGALYEIRPENDGIDPGDRLTAFATFVKPLLGDYLSLDLTYLVQHQQDDSYNGKIVTPTAKGPMIVDRPPFSGGTTQFIGPSLILIPNPLFRFTVSGLFRINEPDLGPSPPHVVGVGFQYTFASGLFR